MDEPAVNVAHLFSRAGFGALAEEVNIYKHWPYEDVVDLVLDTNRAPTPPAHPNLSSSRGYHTRWVDMVHYWLDLARRPVDQAPVVEKMVLFWHGLLCSSMDKLYNHRQMMDQNHLFRTLGMGNYDTLLHAVSTDAALVRYLDNHINVAGSVNENFARELMELFTTGVGHYSEDDVRESARAWTGHGVDGDDHKGWYRFDPGAHDWDNKTFMGRTGNFDGPDIIDIIFAERRQAHARFMCHRLWSFFAYPVELDSYEVTDIMSAYLPSLNIRDTLRAIFLHPKFRTDKARHGLLRSPVEYVVAVMRHTSTDCATAHPEWYLGGLGQLPFYPPNVAGWGANKYWATDSAAWAKLHLASQMRWHAYNRNDILEANKVIDYSPLTFKHTAAESVDMALWNFKLPAVTSVNRQRLIDYVETERASDHRWTERAGLLMLTLLLPEFQLA
jgi:uncharacterized protein (DUF1800 family)